MVPKPTSERADYDTFEAYCRERWGWGSNYARKQIRAAEVVGVIEGENGTTVPKPQSEWVARPLTKFTM